MAVEGGIYLDILARLNIAPVTAALKDLKMLMREAGKQDSEAFTSAFNLSAVKAQFNEVAQAANAAYLDMQNGLARLQIAEARINQARAANYGKHTQEMIAAQRELDAAIANSQKLMQASTAAAADNRAAMLAPVASPGDRSKRSREPGKRGKPEEGARSGRSIYPVVVDDSGGVSESRVPEFGRGISEHFTAGHIERHFYNGARGAAHLGGLGAALGTGLAFASGIKQNVAVQRDMQEVLAKHQDALHNAAYASRQTQALYQLAGQVPYTPAQLAEEYKSIENMGYTGQAAIDVLKTSAQSAVATNGDLKTTTEGLMTSMRDFGVQTQLTSTNVDQYNAGLQSMNQMAGQLLETLGGLKGVKPEELFGALGNVEPAAMMYMKNLPGGGPAASAQVMSAFNILAQIGINPDQASHNISRIITLLGSVPQGSKTYNMLGQLGIPGGPESIVQSMDTQGLFPTFQMIDKAINARQITSGPDKGKIDIGWRYNNQQVSELEQQGYAGMSDAAKQFFDEHPEIKLGLGTKYRDYKAMMKASGLSGADIGDLSTLMQWYSMTNGPNKFTKQGAPTALTRGQIMQIMLGTGDIARTGLALDANANKGQDVANKLTQSGADALKKGVDEMMKTLPVEWKQFGANLKSLAGQLTQHVLPTLVRWTSDLNDFLDHHKEVAKNLLKAMGVAAAAWLAFKTKIPQMLFKMGKGVINWGAKGWGEGAPVAKTAGAEDEAAGTLDTAATSLETSATQLSDSSVAFKDATAVFSDAARVFADATAPFQSGVDNLERAGSQLSTAADQLETASGELKTVATVGKQAQAAVASGGGTAVIPTEEPGSSRGSRGILGSLGGKKMAMGLGGMIGTSMLMPDHVGGMPDALTNGLNTAAGLSWLAGPEVGAPVTATVATVELIASLVHAENINLSGPVDIPHALGYQINDTGPGGFLPSMLKNYGGRSPYWWASGSKPHTSLNEPVTPTESMPQGAPALAPSDVPGKSLGGIIGFKSGGMPPVNPYSQPLLSIPDKGVDTVLGTLPNGSPVGLRGGEGILTPEAVQRIGGEEGINALNNPWADPFKVGATFYGSFAKGVAKYSPWGKYLEATSQTIDSLQQEFDNSTQTHQRGRGGGKVSLYERLLGISDGSGAWPTTNSGAPKGKGGIVDAVKQAYLEAGFPLDQWKDVEHIIHNESGWNPTARNPKSGAYGLGQFLGHQGDKYGAMGAYSGNPLLEARAMMAYIADRYGSPAAAWSHWRANHSYARGGIVGFNSGGRVPMPTAGGKWNLEPDRRSRPGHPVYGWAEGSTNHVPLFQEGAGLGLPPDTIFGGMWNLQNNYDTGIQSHMHSRDSHINDWWSGPSGTLALLPKSHGYPAYPSKNFRIPGMVLGASRGGLIGYATGGIVAPIPQTIGGGPGQTSGDARNKAGYVPIAPNVGRRAGKSSIFEPDFRPHFASGPNDMDIRMTPNKPGDTPNRHTPSYAHGGIVGYATGGFVNTPNQPGSTVAQAVPSITTQARAKGIAPTDGAQKPDLAPTDMPDRVVSGSALPGPKQVSATPQRATPGPSQTPNKNQPLGPARAFHPKNQPHLTPEGTQPGQYASPGDDRKLHGSSSRQPGMNNKSKGFGVGGGLIGSAEGAAQMAASTAANMFAPGSGAAASQAMNIGFQLANRAMGYAGQLVGIGIEGLVETFLPNDSPLADPTNNILGKAALGIAGAHPSPKNYAGNSQMALKPKQNMDAGMMAGKQMPGIHINGDVHNHGQQEWDGLQKAVTQGTNGWINGASHLY